MEDEASHVIAPISLRGDCGNHPLEVKSALGGGLFKQPFMIVLIQVWPENKDRAQSKSSRFHPSEDGRIFSSQSRSGDPFVGGAFRITQDLRTVHETGGLPSRLVQPAFVEFSDVGQYRS